MSRRKRATAQRTEYEHVTRAPPDRAGLPEVVRGTVRIEDTSKPDETRSRRTLRDLLFRDRAAAEESSRALTVAVVSGLFSLAVAIVGIVTPLVLNDDNPVECVTYYREVTEFYESHPQAAVAMASSQPESDTQARECGRMSDLITQIP